jgi:Raf kinase inhibitor-like YbhB/YbcL family protein
MNISTTSFNLTNKTLNNIPVYSIPSRNICNKLNGNNISPQLSWTINENAESYVLIVSDPDAGNTPFIHWILSNIPAYLESDKEQKVNSLFENISTMDKKIECLDLSETCFDDYLNRNQGISYITEVKDDSHIIQAKNSNNTYQYFGPCPPSGKVHYYYFSFYSLNKSIKDANIDYYTPEKFENEYKNLILSKSMFIGLYNNIYENTNQ